MLALSVCPDKPISLPYNVRLSFFFFFFFYASLLVSRAVPVSKLQVNKRGMNKQTHQVTFISAFPIAAPNEQSWESRWKWSFCETSSLNRVLPEAPNDRHLSNPGMLTAGRAGRSALPGSPCAQGLARRRAGRLPGTFCAGAARPTSGLSFSHPKEIYWVRLICQALDQVQRMKMKKKVKATRIQGKCEHCCCIPFLDQGQLWSPLFCWAFSESSAPGSQYQLLGSETIGPLSADVIIFKSPLGKDRLLRKNLLIKELFGWKVLKDIKSVVICFSWNDSLTFRDINWD